MPLPGVESTASDDPLAFDTTTIAGTPLTFTYTPSLRRALPLCHCEEPQATNQTMASATPKTPSLRGAAGDHDAVPAHSGLQVTYFPSGNNTQPTPITQYPLIPTTNGIAKLFSQLTAEEAILFAREGKWEVSADGALRYLGMRGRGGMEQGIIDHAESSANREDIGAFCVLSSRTAAEASTAVSKNDESATYIAALPTPVLKNILSYTDAATCVATYQLSKSYLELLDLWEKALARAQLLIPKVLGNNFVSTKAWQALGVEVSTLPELSPALIKEVKRRHKEREQPLLVLDLGKSIQEIEALCKAKDITVFSTQQNSGDEKLRAESCYSAAGPESPRWLLLPGSDHGVLPGSRNLHYARQVQHMHTCYPGYEVGGARELVTLAMLKYLQDRTTVLFPGDPEPYGRCKDVLQNTWAVYKICLGCAKASSPSVFGGLVVSTSLRFIPLHATRVGLFSFVVS